MLYFIVPINPKGVMDIDYNHMRKAIQRDGICYVAMDADSEVKGTWTPISKEEFDALTPAVEPAPYKPDRITQLEQVVDALLIGGGTP